MCKHIYMLINTTYINYIIHAYTEDMHTNTYIQRDPQNHTHTEIRIFIYLNYIIHRINRDTHILKKKKQLGACRKPIQRWVVDAFEILSSFLLLLTGCHKISNHLQPSLPDCHYILPHLRAKATATAIRV